MTKIGYNAFGICTSLTTIAVDPLNSAYSSVDGILFNKSQTTLIDYPGGKVGGYMIANGVTSVGDNAFDSCPGLTSITIPNSVTNIGYGAFGGCSSLTNALIGNNVTSIGGGAFSGCHSLTNVIIPTSVTYIGYWTFANCTGLTSVMLTNGLVSIDRPSVH